MKDPTEPFSYTNPAEPLRGKYSTVQIMGEINDSVKLSKRLMNKLSALCEGRISALEFSADLDELCQDAANAMDDRADNERSGAW